MSGIEQIIPPMLVLTRKGFLAAVEDLHSLETCGESALAGGYFDGLQIIDSRGRCWEVEHAEKIENVGPLGGRRLLRSRRIRVRLKVREGALYDLAALQQHICEAIEAFPEQWEAFEDISETQARVNGAADISALIQLFAGQA